MEFLDKNGLTRLWYQICNKVDSSVPNVQYIDSITFDGDTTGLEYLEGYFFVKVSDRTLSKSSLVNRMMLYTAEEKDTILKIDSVIAPDIIPSRSYYCTIIESDGVIALRDSRYGLMAAIALEDNVVYEDITFPSKGVYFAYFDLSEFSGYTNKIYVSSLCFTDENGTVADIASNELNATNPEKVRNALGVYSTGEVTALVETISPFRIDEICSSL